MRQVLARAGITTMALLWWLLLAVCGFGVPLEAGGQPAGPGAPASAPAPAASSSSPAAAAMRARCQECLAAAAVFALQPRAAAPPPSDGQAVPGVAYEAWDDGMCPSRWEERIYGGIAGFMLAGLIVLSTSAQ